MKLRIFIMTFTLFTIFISCKKNVNEKENLLSKNLLQESLVSDDYKIINSTFIHLIILTPPGGLEREFGYDNFNYKNRKILKELIKDVYFTNSLVSIKDSIFSFHNVSDTITLNDKEFEYLYTKLVTENFSELSINLDSITNVGFFKLLPAEKDKKFRKTTNDISNDINNIITYSRIVYNKEKDKAAFYFDKNCSGLCGYGLFVFVEKIDGIWIIKKNILAWIS